MPTVEFLFDYASRYGYLANERRARALPGADLGDELFWGADRMHQGARAAKVGR